MYFFAAFPNEILLYHYFGDIVQLLWKNFMVAVENIFLLWFQWKKCFLFLHYVFQKTKTKTKKQKQAKIISSWTWFSKRLLSFVVKWKPFVFIFDISRDEIFCFFYYNNDDKVNFIYELSIFNKLHDKHKLLENNRSKLVTGFYIEGYSIWFVL